MPEPAANSRVLLLGWDAADWQILMPLVEQGLMPTLAGLMARGAWGNLATLQPMISPMLWTTVATGFTADRHGVLGFVEPADGSRGIRPWSSLSRRCKAVWNILYQNGYRTHQIGWWASHPAEPLRGVVVADSIRESPAPPGCVHPAEETARFAGLKVSPAELDDSHLLPFVPRAAEVDQEKDRRLASLAALISDAAGIHAMATEALEHEPWDFAAVYLDSLDHFFHTFIPWHPPRQPHIAEHDFAIYQEVVRGACRFHDMMLQRLLEIAGPETNIVLCSDHGFLSGETRPRGNPNDPSGPVIWHRDMGVLVMAGPGIKPGTRIEGASLLDITPTILALAGLPCGNDMPGRPLAEVLTGPVPERIPSWEDVPGECGRHPAGTPWTGNDGSALVSRLVALGYLEDPSANDAESAAAARREADANLAQAYLAMGRAEEAVHLLEPLVMARPWESRWLHQLAHALTRAGWHGQCVALLQAAWPEGSAADIPPAVRLLAARALSGMGDHAAARWHLARALQAMPRLTAVFVELGLLAIELGSFETAEPALRRALELDPATPAAWEGLSTIHVRQRRYAEALTSADQALALVSQMPQAQLNRGMALARLGRTAEAAAAFLLVTEWRPDDDKAWRLLAALPDENDAGGFLRAARLAEARLLARRRAAAAADLQRRARELRPLPVIPPPAERQRLTDSERPPEAAPHAPSGRVLTLVSGLPRSGTSLMMQMLAAGGLAPQTDALRPADESNPGGYFEWDAIKRLGSDPTLLDAPHLEHRAVKCIAALLPVLPARHRYRVLFMRRPVEEIAASQDAMLQRQGATAEGPSGAALADHLRRHAAESLAFLRRHPRFFEVLEIDYPSLVAAPGPWIAQIAAFLGPGLLPHPERIAACVSAPLHRHRQPPPGDSPPDFPAADKV